jgi:dTDP-4-amino-4,6-dideoxygalactose transaminase
VRYLGAEPVLCDSVGPGDLNLDPADVAARITPRTKAVLAVHFMGYTADVAALRALCDEHGLALVEDVAQAVGARYPDGRRAGTGGTAGCFSFFSKKQLCVGEGGAVVSADEAVLAKVRSLRSHAMTSVTWDRHRGHADSYDIVDVGFNFRLDEPRAALGLSRLPRLEADIERRRAQVRLYRERLADVDGLSIPWSDDDVERSSHFCFAVLLEDEAARDRLRERLSGAGIQTTWYPSITSFTEYRAAGPCPRAEELARRHVALPLSSSYGEAEVDAVVAAVRDAL